MEIYFHASQTKANTIFYLLNLKEKMAHEGMCKLVPKPLWALCCRKALPLLGIEPQHFQHVANHVIYCPVTELGNIVIPS